MRVLVTGASGFIGSHVCRALNRAGHEIIGLDAAGTRPGACAGWIAADITQPLVPIPGLDAVVHLAAIANPRECDSNPSNAFNVNVNGTHQVLNMAYQSGAKKVVFASTAHVYGISPRYLPTDETHPLWLQNNYTLTKILGEQLCQLYYQNHGLSYVALRLYNAYGPGQSKGYFIPDMLARVQEGALNLKGGATTKDFVHIDDVAHAFEAAVTSSFVGPINIGTGVETPLSDIARAICDTAGVQLELAPGTSPDTQMQADYTRARRTLGWAPTITVQEGLAPLLNGVLLVGVKKAAVPA